MITEILLVPDCYHRPPHRGAPCGLDFQTLLWPKSISILFKKKTRSSAAVVPIFTVDNSLSSTSSKKILSSSDISSWSIFWNWLRNGYQSLLSSSNFINSNFGKLTFLAFCLQVQEMLPLVSCLVGFKQQLPIRMNFAYNSSATTMSTPALASSNSNSNDRVFCSRISSGRVLLLTSNWFTTHVNVARLVIFRPNQFIFYLLPRLSFHTHAKTLSIEHSHIRSTTAKINTWFAIRVLYVKFYLCAVSGAPITQRY